MTAHLLDANVLIAAAVEDHVHRSRVEDWLSSVSGPLAVCPVVEGALMRYLVRAGASAARAGALLRAYTSRPDVEFWPDDVSYTDVDTRAIRGHRQVTDAYLVALAVAHGGVLATLDAGLARAHPDGAVLIPA